MHGSSGVDPTQLSPLSFYYRWSIKRSNLDKCHEKAHPLPTMRKFVRRMIPKRVAARHATNDCFWGWVGIGSFAVSPQKANDSNSDKPCPDAMAGQNLGGMGCHCFFGFISFFFLLGEGKREHPKAEKSFPLHFFIIFSTHFHIPSYSTSTCSA